VNDDVNDTPDNPNDADSCDFEDILIENGEICDGIDNDGDGEIDE
jgi:hypothetical protein